MRLGIIGGTGLAALDDGVPAAPSRRTPYGDASAVPQRCAAFGEAVFLNRHGEGHALLPHEINYRANLWLLRELGAEAVVAVFAVGGIGAGLADGQFVLPRQLVDYTWGRAHTFATSAKPLYADFTEPFTPQLGERIRAAADAAHLPLADDEGVYGCTQGPRLETAGEIDRLERDGCTVVGMTAMPEAALARELALAYAGICLVVNPAAGRGEGGLTVAAMRRVVDGARPRLLRLLATLTGATP